MKMGSPMRQPAPVSVAAFALAVAGLAGCVAPSDDARPALAPDPATISFSVDAASTDTVSAPATLGFAGAEAVVWSATTDQAWLSVEPSSGLVSFGSAVDVVVTADPSGLASGLWVGHVFFEDVLGAIPGGVLTVVLYVGVDEQPGVLTASPNPSSLHALVGYATAVTREVTLTLEGESSASVSASPAAAWLLADLADDTPMDPGDAVTVTLSVAPGQPLGLQQTSVTFATAGGEAAPLVLPVALAVRPTTPGTGSVVYYQSSIDLSPQPYGLRRPTGFPAGGPFPLAIHLHGYSINWKNGLTSFYGTSKADADKWILVNLGGRGNKFYDGPGETDLLEVIEDVAGAYDLDRTRIFLEGSSMGATGAFRHLARHPDVFAGGVGVDGWTDHRQWHRHWYGPAAVPYEVHSSRFGNLEAASPVTHAESVAPDRLGIVVDTGDTYVWTENGYKLESRLSALGTLVDASPSADLPYVEYGGGHTAWYGTHVGEIYDWLGSRAPLDPDPEDTVIRFRSNRLRTARHSWLRVERFGWDGFAEVEAKRLPLAGGTCTFEITARNVERLVITSAPDPGAGGSYLVKVNGVECAFARDASPPPLRVGLTLGGFGDVLEAWPCSAPPAGALQKTPAGEGPVARALSERFIVAWGSADPARTAVNEMNATELCKEWADDWTLPLDLPGNYGFNAVITPVDEATLTAADLHAANLVVFGTAESSLLIARMCEDATLPFNVPVQILEDAITVNGETFPVPDHGIWMVYPNPLAPGRLAVIGHNVVGSGADGNWGEILWTQEGWPWMWPDYVVFDTSVPLTRLDRQGEKYAADQFVLAGDFDRDWRLRGDAEPRTDVAVSTNLSSYAEGATATVTVDVTNELGAYVAGLPAAAFAFRVDGEARSATYTGGSYSFTLSLAGLAHKDSTDPDPGVTSFDLTVEVVRPNPSTGKPLAGLGRARFTVY